MAEPCISENTELVETQFSVESHICSTEYVYAISVDHLVRLSIALYYSCAITAQSLTNKSPYFPSGISVATSYK